MFYLRILFNGNNDHVENICLGNRYRKVTSKFKCGEYWIDKPRRDYPSCGMFIFPEVGDPIPIYSNNNSYIVTDSGATYEKLNPVDKSGCCSCNDKNLHAGLRKVGIDLPSSTDKNKYSSEISSNDELCSNPY